MKPAVVVGGGLAGLAAAVAVAKAGIETIHVAPQGPPDRRTSALMLPSVDYLQGAGLIDDPASLGHPLTQIRIIDATRRLIRAPETLFDSAEAGLPAFGWNFANVKLAAAFEAARATLPRLTTRQTTVEAMQRWDDGWALTLGDGGILEASLVVGADGKKSRVRDSGGFSVREHEFEQAALVCDLEIERPIGGTSVEFHYENGPFTFVPAGGTRANLVWIDQRPVLDAARSGPPEALAELFAQKSQRLFGRITPVTPAFVFPLSTLSVDLAGRDGIVLTGESGHAFPPIGAQGLNLGLRDVADLAAALAGADNAAPDFALRVSADYAALRSADLARTGAMVDTLFRSLLSGFLPSQALRAGGLWALKLSPALRRTAFDTGMGLRK